jgi:predicted SprT family Zn-dependent metalloprotease
MEKEKTIKYLCPCGGRFDEPDVREQHGQSFYVCPECETLIGLLVEEEK